MGKGRHGGGHGGGGHGGHGGFGGHHGGGFGGHPGGGGFAHHGGVGARGGVGIGGMHGAMQHGPGGFHHGGMGVGVGHSHHRMFHGGPGYRGWWHPGGFGYWHGGWAAGYGWFGRPCFGWFYPGWFYGWYSNLMFPGSPWFFGYPYYRPWYLPPRPTTTVVVIQQSQPQPTVAALPTNALSDSTNVYGSAATAGVPPSYAVATSAGVGPSESSFASASAPDVSAVLASNGAAPFGGEGDAEPSLPPAYSSSIKATIEAAFDYACQHASVFWKFADSYPSGFAEIDAYFQRFAVQKEIDSAVFPDSSIQNTLSFWDKLFCSADSTFLRKKELRTQRIKSAYREFLLHHTATESSDFNNNYSNFQIAAHSLYGCLSKRYSNMNSNEPVIFDFEELKAFIAMLENRFGTTELAIDTEKSKSGQVPFFVVVQKNGR